MHLHALARALRIALLLVLAPAVAGAQEPEHQGELEGVVRDAETSEPLAGAVVSLVGGRNSAVTHGDGSFHLRRVSSGVYTLRAERLGYRTATLEVTVGDASAVVVVQLDPAPIDIGGVVVTGLGERSADETLRPVNVVSGQDLQRRLEGTVAATLSSEPGLASTSMGPATARPVIRGMSGDRVLMLEDGARVGDVSNTGSDHATALDPTSARRIEVVRGPGALLYGSNALGGVINVIRDEVPSSVPHHLTGSATLQTQSVNGGAAASASGTMPLAERIPLRVEGTFRTSQDLKTPVGSLENTAGDTWSAGVGSAWVGDGGFIGAAVRAYRNDYGIPGGFEGGHEEGVRIEMERASTKFRARMDDAPGLFESVELDGTYTWYRHTEIEPPDILGTFFKLQTASGDVLARHGAWGPFSSGAVGVRGSWEAFEFAGSLQTPDSRRTTAAGYVVEEIDLDPFLIEAGLRYDWVRASPLEEDLDASIGPIEERTFNAASGSLGVLLRAGAGFTVGTSISRAFRTPDINELFSEGPHLAAYVYEVGNPSLGTEVGTGVDLFVRFASDRVRAEVTGFYNDMAGYVYGEETGNLSPTLLPIYQFQSNDASLRGAEAGLDANVAGGFTLGGTVSYVRGAIEPDDTPLPLMPPLNGRLFLEYDRPSWFARAESELAAKQDRIGEFETETPGYTVFHASAGLRLTVMGRLNVLTIGVQNLTDEEYRNHLSRVKEIMPEAGRGLSLTYRVVF